MNIDSVIKDKAAEPTTHKWIIAFTVMIIAIIEMIDITIVNVSLPHMMGSLSANTDQITWVLTSYVVASAICMPLSGFLVKRYGLRPLLLTLIFGFTCSSVLCGLAANLEMLVVCRALQGAFGAGLIPISQYVMSNTFAPHERGKAMALWGVGIMVAPIFGPVLGGFITQTLHWRWIFFINLPVGILALLLAYLFIGSDKTTKTAIDWLGILLFAIGIGALQMVLDRGNHLDWFDSRSIQVTFLISLFCLGYFIIRGRHHQDNIIDFSLFKDLNFTICCLLVMLFCFSFYATVALLPLEMEELLHYPADIAGLVLAPRGIASALAMLYLGKKINEFDPRLLIALGICFSAYSTYMLCHFNLQTDMAAAVLIPNIIQGIGIGCFFLPATTLAISAFSEHQTASATGVYNFFRHFGGSVGIAIFSSVLSRQQQVQWHRLASHLDSYRFPKTLLQNPHTMQWYKVQLTARASQAAFNQSFWLISAILLISIPVLFLLRKPTD